MSDINWDEVWDVLLEPPSEDDEPVPEYYEEADADLTDEEVLEEE